MYECEWEEREMRKERKQYALQRYMWPKSRHVDSSKT